MDNGTHLIAIISDQKPRTEVLSRIIKSNFEQIDEIPIISSDDLDSIINIEEPLILLIDLMGTTKSSKDIILPLREMDATIKMIVLHMYQSPKLINPLYDMGVKGYVYYEPSRRELVDAIKKVTDGETYRPEYLRSA